jgi:hypothetical protein
MKKELNIPDLITPEEYLDYLVSSVRLKLWFCWHFLSDHPEDTFVDTIQNRVDIWRRTSLNPNFLDGPLGSLETVEWKSLIAALEEIYIKNRQSGSAKSFEDESISVLTPFLLLRVDRDICDITNKVDLGKYQCGSLRYDLEPVKDNPQRISFHIANACYPLSPFADPGYFPRCFIDMMNQCQEKFKVTEISTTTWLNSYPKWLKLFPSEWSDNMGVPDTNVYWHYGFWGQFITGRRTFNHKLGQQFRDTGCIPYPMRSSWCTISAMRKHLCSFVTD